MKNFKSIDLNILDRGLQGQQWTSERGKITANDLQKVQEKSTSNGAALNALPTPFARFYIFREAFRRVHEEKINPKNEAGQAYHRLVSDCLDVYELLFNLKYHRNHWGGERDIIIKEWEQTEDMPRLKKKMPVLYNALENYYATDIRLSRLFFIVLKENGKEKLLGTSSPITGFITPPDLDRRNVKGEGNTVTAMYMGDRYEGLKLQRKAKDGQRFRGYYFSEVELFDKRPADFKNYMYRMFSGDVSEEMRTIKQYITSFGETDDDIRNDYVVDWLPVESMNNERLEFCGITICSSNALDVGKFFTDSIIKLPYRMSEENFLMPQFEGKDDRKYDYLLPLTEYAMGIINPTNLSCRLKEKALGKKIMVELTHNGKTYSKTYEDSIRPVEGIGRIIDFKKPFNLNLEMGLFPNIRSCNTAENNYYKLMLIATDGNERRTFSLKDSYCTFFAPGEGANVVLEESDNKSYRNGVRTPVVRSEQSDDVKCSTKFYEVFNSEISAICLNLNIEGQTHSGVLVPRFHEPARATREFTYAIDFGTSNTYISKRLKGSNIEPEQLSMTSTMMSSLHAVRKSRQLDAIDLCEEMAFEDSADFFRTEFVPPFIDGTKYRFPLRTAMVKTQRELQEPELFNNRNIAFSYEKKRIVAGHEITTDIKWDESTTEARLFIRELLLIVKCDVLLSDGDLSKTEVVWFYPLSLSPKLKAKFDDIWKEETARVLGITGSQVRSYTESEAPYYYYAEKDVFDSIDSVAVIDIGGGSTDMVYLQDGKPQIANSVHFGCDVLWGNGHNKMSNARDNGIYQRYKDLVSFGDEAELNDLNREMLRAGSTVSTRDIINFWISNSDKTRMGGDENFTSLLRQECKPVFLYHYASIIFYMASLIKTKGLPCPKAITFSGNGSRYIDNFITSDINTLTDLTMIILTDAFGADTRRVQLIMRDCRKEATCYGGLYREPSKPSPEAVIYNGVDNTQYDTVADMTHDFEQGSLRAGLIDNVNRLGTLYMEMLRTLVRKEELENINSRAIEQELKEGHADALDKNFKQEIREKMDPNIKYKDSLFFIPITDKVIDLTQVSKYIK